MSLVTLLVLMIFLVFASAIIFGAPYLPTLKDQIKDALVLLDLSPGQTMYEFGSGDGRVLKAAAKLGVRAVGYEINPFLVIYSKLNCWQQREFVEIHWRNFWHVQLQEADALYVFLLNPYMAKLHEKIENEIDRPLKVVSFAFAIPGEKPLRTKKGIKMYEFLPRS